MTKVITINRNPGDFIRSTRHLSLEERGAYQDILDQIVELGQDEDPPSLPDDDRALSGILGCTPARWRQIKQRLCTGSLAVLICENGRISQARIVEEIEEAKIRIGAASKAGVASGAARRRKSQELRARMANNRSTSVEQLLNVDANGSRTDVEREGERIANVERTSGATDCEPVTSHESRNTKDSKSDDVVSLLAQPVEAGDAVSYLTAVGRKLASHLEITDDWVRGLLRRCSVGYAIIAAAWLEKREYLRKAQAVPYLEEVASTRGRELAASLSDEEAAGFVARYAGVTLKERRTA